MWADMTWRDKRGITQMQDPGGKLSDEQKRAIAMAEDILRIVTAGICRENIFLEVFARIFEWVPVREDILLETDGRHLFYQPERLIREFRKKGSGEIRKMLLHIICHGMFGHFALRGEMEDTGLIDSVMDYEVMRFIRGMGWKVPWDERQQFWLEYQEQQVGTEDMGSRRLYRKLEKTKNAAWTLEKELRFEQRDDHEVWLRDREYHLVVEIREAEGAQDGNGICVERLWEEARRIAFGELAPDPETILRRMADGQSGIQAGTDPGKTTDTVRADAENGRSYREVLEQFFREEEGLREREDTIDKKLYAYGFEMYENIALIEPEEDCEHRRLHTLAIAIDTSGSTANVMGRFLRETRNILHDICAEGSFEKIILLQCDAAIQKESVYRFPEELPQEDAFSISGFGGTDFRPVFQRLDELTGAGVELDCLIYLTDGFGFFPEKKPDYPTFLILSERFGNVPEWAEKIYLDLEEIR